MAILAAILVIVHLTKPTVDLAGKQFDESNPTDGWTDGRTSKLISSQLKIVFSTKTYVQETQKNSFKMNLKNLIQKGMYVC